MICLFSSTTESFCVVMVSDVKLSVAVVHGCTCLTFLQSIYPTLDSKKKQ